MNKKILFLVCSLLMATVIHAQDAFTTTDNDNATVTSETTAMAATVENTDATSVIPLLMMDTDLFAVNDATSVATTTATYTHKYPGISLLLSCIYPGLGQFYNGGTKQTVKGIIMATLTTVGLICIAVAVSDENQNHEDYGAAGTLLYVPTWIWSMIDAPIAAGKINRRNAAALSWNVGEQSVFSVRPDVKYAHIGLGTKREAICGLSLSLAF
jgi:TM2 domain-containing membrane protein YozV